MFLTELELHFEATGVRHLHHFARPEDELSRARRDRTLHRNFQGYTTKAGTDLIGFGMSAIGSVGEHYVQNRRELPAYRAAVAADGAASFRGFLLSPAGPTMNSVPRRVLEFWRNDRFDWERVPELEIDIDPENPHRAEQKDATGRVVRGGFGFDVPELGRSGRRSFAAPDNTTGIALGFRVAVVGDLKAKPPAAEVAPAPRAKP